ncbi:MAG: YbaB/EbfC family nucleoid-associated protein [Pseudomonadota bacterium]
MKNLGGLMKQAQEFQTKLAELQTELEAMEIDGEAGGGMVKARLDGKGYLKGLTIDPSLLAADEKDVLEDLIIAAQNDARKKADERKAEEMQKLTGGLPLPPGFKMPV